MGTRDAEHTQWNLDHGLVPNSRLRLFCPRCGKPHQETLTSDPSQPDYFHHVHQCVACGLRFEVFVRCRSTVESTLPHCSQCNTPMPVERELCVVCEFAAGRSAQKG